MPVSVSFYIDRRRRPTEFGDSTASSWHKNETTYVSSWEIAAARPGSTRISKKKTGGAGSLSGDDPCSEFEGKDQCAMMMDQVCDGEDFYSSPCMACANGAKGPFRHLGTEGRPDDCKK